MAKVVTILHLSHQTQIGIEKGIGGST